MASLPQPSRNNHPDFSSALATFPAHLNSRFHHPCYIRCKGTNYEAPHYGAFSTPLLLLFQNRPYLLIVFLVILSSYFSLTSLHASYPDIRGFLFSIDHKLVYEHNRRASPDLCSANAGASSEFSTGAQNTNKVHSNTETSNPYMP